MAEYPHTYCISCGNSEKGTSIHKCTNCGYIGCFKGGGIMSSSKGCYPSSRCPKCDKMNSSRQLTRL